MKTLDEVIEAQERCATYPHCHFCYLHSGPVCEWIRDALHYLKDMKNLQEDYDILYDKYWREYNQQQENPPLTWNELKQMEGKPVWVEAESLSVGVSPYWKDWYIIKSFSNDEFMYCNDGFEWAKEMQGRLWQAYRKERA